jgi:integrase
VRLCDLDPPKIAACVRDLERAGYAPATIGQTYKKLKAALADAVRHNLLPFSPCDRMRGPKEVHPPPEHFDEAELDAFRAAVVGDPDRALWETAIETGMRFGECAALRWANLDLVAGELRVAENLTRTEANRRALGTPKSQAGGRAIVLSDDLVAILRAHREEVRERMRLDPAWNRLGLVFPGGRGGYRCHAWTNERLARLCAAAGVRVLSFHGLRHSSGTFQVEAGVPIKTVSERLGHADPATTLRMYVHPDRAAHRRAADAFGAFLRGRRSEPVAKSDGGATKPRTYAGESGDQ